MAILLEILDQGERDAILLALKKKLPLLIEEEAGREAAQRLGLKISGIAGQILQAFRQHLIDLYEAEKKLYVLYDAGRINKRIYEGLKEIMRKEI